jgi:dTDP-4-dehydrorhamnose 3,5-epimerase
MEKRNENRGESRTWDINYRMNVKLTELTGVLLITPSVTFADFRGTNTENWNRIEYEDYGIHNDWVLDSISTSRKHVLRGIHGDGHTTKLISCLYGEIYFVVINNDPDSNQYKQWQSFHLSGANRQQVLVPPKFGNGHLVMSDHAVFSYKLDAYYDIKSQFTIKWNDYDTHNIWWPIKNPITSLRDS